MNNHNQSRKKNQPSAFIFRISDECKNERSKDTIRKDKTKQDKDYSISKHILF
jgi:hypothetical protein